MKKNDLSKIDREVIDVFDQINFSPRVILLIDNKDLHYVIKGEIEGQEVLFKSYSTAHKNKSDNLIREGEIGNLLKKENARIKTFDIINFGSNTKIAWVVRKYYQGKTLAYDLSSKNIWPFMDRYSVINSEFIAQPERYISLIVDNNKLLSLVSSKHFRSDRKKNRFKSVNFEKIINQISSIFSINLEKTNEIYLKNKNYFDNNDNKKVISGDMSPTNIFISNQDEVYIYDFEWAGLGNYMTDFAFLWLFLWKYPNWQGVLIKETINNDFDKLNFRLNIIRIITYFYRIIPPLAEKINGKETLNIISKYKKHIWLKYLDTAGESFEETIKLIPKAND